MDPLLLLGAAFVGIVVGLTGMGGGALMTPLLVLGFHINPAVAVSSDIVASAFMKPVGSFVHSRRGTVNWKLAMWLVIGSVPTAALGVFIANRLANPDALEHWLRNAIGVVLLLAAAGLIMRAYVRLRERARTLDGTAFPLPHSTGRVEVKPRIFLTVLLGAVGGLLVGLTSVGSGSLMIVAMMAIYPAMRAPQLVGTDLAQAVPLVFTAAISHIAVGHVDWHIVLQVIIGSVPGTFLGAHLSSRVSGGIVRRALALVLLMAALTMLKVPTPVVFGAVVAALVVGTLAWARLRRHYGFPMFIRRKKKTSAPIAEPPEHRLTRVQVHELELAGAGAYPGGMAYGSPDDLDTPSLLFRGKGHQGEIVLVDLESTPVAKVTVQGERTVDGGTWITGPIETLRPLTQGVFREIRLGTAEASAKDVLVLDGDQTDADVTAVDAIVVLDGDDPARTARRVRWALEQTAKTYVLPEPDLHALSRAKRHKLLAALTTRLLGGKAKVVEGNTVKGDGCVVLFTGLSGSGKSTLARAVAHLLQSADEREVTLLDGDEVRSMVSKGLGFSREDRELNVRRIGWIASLVSRHGGVALCAPIAPYTSSRAELREMAEAHGSFVLVHVNTPLEVCEERDRKGLYAKARAGEILFFTGISDPYEAPSDADLVVDTSKEDIDVLAERVAKAVRATARARA